MTPGDPLQVGRGTDVRLDVCAVTDNVAVGIVGVDDTSPLALTAERSSRHGRSDIAHRSRGSNFSGVGVGPGRSMTSSNFAALLNCGRDSRSRWSH
jgi:hypothetical protein